MEYNALHNNAEHNQMEHGRIECRAIEPECCVNHTDEIIFPGRRSSSFLWGRRGASGGVLC